MIREYYTCLAHYPDCGDKCGYLMYTDSITSEQVVDEKWLDVTNAGIFPKSQTAQTADCLANVKKIRSFFDPDSPATKTEIAKLLSKLGLSNIKQFPRTDPSGKTVHSWCIRTDWVRGKVAQQKSFSYTHGLTSSSCMLEAIRAVCFEGMCPKQNIILGGASKITGVREANGNEVPLPHVCETVEIGSPSEIPAISMVFESTTELSPHLLEKKRKINNDVVNVAFARKPYTGDYLERLYYEDYIGDLFSEGYNEVPERVIGAFINSMYPQTTVEDTTGEHLYPNYMVEKTMSVLREHNSDYIPHHEIDEDEYHHTSSFHEREVASDSRIEAGGLLNNTGCGGGDGIPPFRVSWQYRVG